MIPAGGLCSGAVGGVVLSWYDAGCWTFRRDEVLGARICGYGGALVASSLAAELDYRSGRQCFSSGSGGQWCKSIPALSERPTPKRSVMCFTRTLFLLPDRPGWVFWWP